MSLRSLMLTALLGMPISRLMAVPIPITVAVMPFAAQEGEPQAWLSKGLADIFVRSLAEVPSLAVVERDQMQAFLREMELGKAPLFDQSQALRAGRVARVRQILYGSYALKGSHIAIDIFLLDMEQQKIIAAESIDGPLHEVQPLVQKLTLQILSSRGISLTEAARAHLHFKVTDSIGALEHFYRGIDFYDRGLPADAYGEFFSATQQDPRYAEAKLWSGRMFEELGDWDQAVLAYRQLFQDQGRATEGLDALYFAGQILEKQLAKPDEAIRAYQVLMTLAPETPQALEAAFALAQRLEAKENPAGAYKAYAFVDAFRRRVQADPKLDFRSPIRKSRFINWDHALNLYQQSAVKMISLYPYIGSRDPGVPKPRGLLEVSSQSPSFQEAHWDNTQSIFYPANPNPNWVERTYVAMAPPGTVATAVDLVITGRLIEVNPNRDYTLRVLPFPLPRDYMHGWLGTIYGQTSQMTTLHKTISFHGENRKLFAVQVIENGSEIQNWGIKLHLQPIALSPAVVNGGSITSTSKEFWEGQPLASIFLPPESNWGGNRSISDLFYRPQKELAVAAGPNNEFNLITAQGDLDGQQTDLWFTQSKDGRNWPPLSRLPTNSLSEDYNPRLICAEDGKLRLSWISNRRGVGWELWTSMFAGAPATLAGAGACPYGEPQARCRGEHWTSPIRIPLEKFAKTGMEERSNHLNDLLEYDFMQDSRGRWMIAFYAYGTGELVILRTRDFQEWEVLAKRATPTPLYGFSLMEDRTVVIRMAAVDTQGLVHLGSSTNGKDWREQIWHHWHNPQPSVHSLHLLADPKGGLVLLLSDNAHGVQFARFDPEENEPPVELVPRAELEAYTAARFKSDDYVVALKNSDEVILRRYRTFNTTGSIPKKHSDNWMIFKETEKDDQGNLWNRFTAQERFRVPDVTSLGIEPSGKVWWGIETGIMNKNGDRFFATDVSQGFFNNDVTEMALCDASHRFLASKNLSEPILGFISGSEDNPSFSTMRIPGAHGSLIALSCSQKPGEIYVDTSAGETWKGDGKVWSPAKSELGPSAKRKTLLRRIPNPIYPLLGPVAEDPVKGFWYLPGEETRSKGLVYFNGQTHKIYNPPHDLLDKPSSLAVDKEGHVWIGTWFKGLYELQRKP